MLELFNRSTDADFMISYFLVSNWMSDRSVNFYLAPPLTLSTASFLAAWLSLIKR